MSQRRDRAGADYGRLVRDITDDLVVCHICGRGFRSLGSHLRAHGLSAVEYRREFGLMRSRPLTARSLSRGRSAAQRGAWLASPRMRADFVAGQAMARQGELAREAVRSFAEQGVSPELARVRSEHLAAGRHRQSAQAEARLAARVAALGHDDLGQALRALYVDGDLSQEATARALGVGNERLRELLTRHGIALRRTGANSAAGKQARVAANDLKAAARVGAPDITAWLRQQQGDGASLAELARRTGRSIPWWLGCAGEPADGVRANCGGPGTRW